MGKPFINPLVKYEHEAEANSDIGDVFDYIMALLIQDDPSIMDHIDV